MYVIYCHLSLVVQLDRFTFLIVHHDLESRKINVEINVEKFLEHHVARLRRS